MRWTGRGIALLCCFAVSACAQRSASIPSLSSNAGPFYHTAAVPPDKAAFKSLYSFGKIPYDGETPTNLVPLNGVLYGTAIGGGAHGDGIVFSITPKGSEVILHNFSGKKDGAAPIAQLLNVNGVFYGTATGGGPSGAGVVFSINANGNFKVIRAFQGGSSDGLDPNGGLVEVNGKLYGTTAGGGANGVGTVYSITTSGVEHVLHSFAGNDGAAPYSTLIEVNGMLYGTTAIGGTNDLGTLFRVSTSGSVKVLHSFGAPGDGAEPLYGALANVNGTLYGTTVGGGANGNGFGTIFKSSLGGKEKVLYSFDGTAANGCAPYNGLIAFKGVLYGTSLGGSSSLCTSNGTVFSIQPSGGETTLHTFSGGKGGVQGFGLASMGSKLYGAVLDGGYHDEGLVFSLKP